MKKLTLKIEELEERIAPSFVFTEGSQPDIAGANPTGGQGGLEASFGPNASMFPEQGNLAAWGAHSDNVPTPLDFGGDA